MKIKKTILMLLVTAGISVQALPSLADYSVQTKQAALGILKNPEFRQKLFGPKKEKSAWETFKSWFGF